MFIFFKNMKVEQSTFCWQGNISYFIHGCSSGLNVVVEFVILEQTVKPVKNGILHKKLKKNIFCNLSSGEICLLACKSSVVLEVNLIRSERGLTYVITSNFYFYKLLVNQMFRE